MLSLRQMKIVRKGIRWVAASGAALLIFVQGCGTAHTSTPVSVGQSASKDMGATGTIEVCAVQYAMSTGGEGDETVEVLFRNDGDATARFVRVTLDDIELPPIKADVQAAMRHFRFDELAKRGRSPTRFTPVAGARWWQFWPSPHVAAGGHGAFQLNFAGHSRPCRLVFSTSEGRELHVQIPRYSTPRRALAYLAFSGDGRLALMRHSKGGLPVAVRVNGVPVGFRALAPLGKGMAGGIVAELSNPVREGEIMLVEVGFSDGHVRFALARAMLGVCTVAPDGWHDDKPLPESARNAYGFDPVMRIHRLACDPVCDDARAREHGASARDMVGLRKAWTGAHEDRLCGVDFCTAMYPSAWNIYSQMADAVFAKPYRLHWGRNPARFIDEEDAFVAETVQAVAPRPVIWVPERFGVRRRLEGAEFETLAWCALLRGARGIRVHHWKNKDGPFVGTAGMSDAIKRFNRDFNRLRPRLEKLIPAGGYDLRRERVAVAAGWVANEGLLAVVRNLRYDTGVSAAGGARIHPFSVTALADVRLPFRLPKSFVPETATDALTGETLGLVPSGGGWTLTMPELQSFRLVWISGEHVADDVNEKETR